MNRLFVWLLAVTTAAGIGYMILSEIDFVFYEGDEATISNDFWKDKRSHFSKLTRLLVPMQIPGPLDTWAGGESKEIEMETPGWSGVRMEIRFYDSHESAPPLIHVLANGRPAGEFRVSAGAGTKRSRWKTAGTPSILMIDITPKQSGGSIRSVTLRSVEGSWAIIERITIKRLVPVWAFAATVIGAILLMLLYLRYLSVNRLWKEHAVNLGLTLFCAFLTLAAVELALRNFFPQQQFIPSFRPVYMADDDIGYVLKPNVKARLGKDTNRFGMRDFDRYARSAPEEVFRILAVGDSFTYSLTTMENAWPKFMERIYKAKGKQVEVMNSGVPGYGTDEEYYYLKKYGLRFEPDLVVLAFFVGNDITDNYSHPVKTVVDGELVSLNVAKQMTRAEMTWKKRKKLFLNRFHLLRLLSNRNYSGLFREFKEESRRTRAAMNTDREHCIVGIIKNIHTSPRDYNQTLAVSWSNTLEYLDKTYRLAEKNGVELVTVLIPSAIQLDTAESIRIRSDLGNEEKWKQPQKALMEQARKRGWAMFDTAPYMKAKANNRRLYYCRDTHFNELGNRLLAEAIAGWLEEKGIGPARTLDAGQG